MNIQTEELQDAGFTSAQTNSDITTQVVVGSKELRSHLGPGEQWFVVSHTPNGATPAISSLPNDANHNHSIPARAGQPCRGSESSPSRRNLEALKRVVAIGKHRKTQSASVPISLGGGDDANTFLLHKRASSLVEISPKPDIECDIAPAKMKFEVTLSPFITSRHDRHGLRLVDRLAEVYAREDFTKHKFIPNGQLDEMITQKSAEQELSRVTIPTYLRHRLWRKTVPQIIATSSGLRSNPQSSLELDGGALSSGIEKRFQKVFAILVMIRCPHKVWAFIKEGIHDGDLPLCSNRTGNAEGGLLARSQNPETALKCLKKEGDVSDFLERQWRVLVPSFFPSKETPVPYLKIAANAILPFVQWAKNGQQGGCGDVRRVQIHEMHHSFPENEVSRGVVAVKMIFDDRNSFNREFNSLRHLLKLKHATDHFVTLLAAYEQENQFCLILPWAELDLCRYWREKTSDMASVDYGTTSVSVWIFEQCCLLVEAVSLIQHFLTTSGTSLLHPEENFLGQNLNPIIRSRRNSLTLVGRHGDIKPANILWYPKSDTHGTLRLSDFGTAHFSKADDKSSLERGNIASSRPYMSPESVYSDDIISEECDVWALGCVFLEFVCWYFGGYNLVQEFETERRNEDGNASFFVSDYDIPKLKTQVVERIKDLQARASVKGNSHMTTLIQTIKEGMLVRKVDDRKSAGTISRHLGDMRTYSD